MAGNMEGIKIPIEVINRATAPLRAIRNEIESISKQMRTLSGQFAATTSSFNGATATLTTNVNTMTNRAGLLAGSFKPVNDAIATTTNNIDGMGNRFKITYDGWKNLNKNMIKSHKELSAGVEKNRMEFEAQYLSIMFFGMFIQRIFDGIKQQGIDAFMRITEGATDGGQAINGLRANFTLLGYSIGYSFGELAKAVLPILQPIIENISNIIQQNPILVAGLISMIATFGAVLMTVGSVYLGISALYFMMTGNSLKEAIAGVGGLRGAFSALKTFIVGTAIPAIKTAWTEFVAFLSAHPIILAIMAIILAIIALKFAWENNFLGMRDILQTAAVGWGEIFTWLSDTIYSLIDSFMKMQETFSRITGNLVMAKFWHDQRVSIAKTKVAVNELIAGYKEWANTVSEIGYTEKGGTYGFSDMYNEMMGYFGMGNINEKIPNDIGENVVTQGDINSNNTTTYNIVLPEPLSHTPEEFADSVIDRIKFYEDRIGRGTNPVQVR